MRNERKAKTKLMLFKFSGKFNWEHISKDWWQIDLPEPRNVRYVICRTNVNVFHLSLERLRDKYGKKHNADLDIGCYSTLQEAQSRAELREARYEANHD